MAALSDSPDLISHPWFDWACHRPCGAGAGTTRPRKRILRRRAWYSRLYRAAKSCWPGAFLRWLIQSASVQSSRLSSSAIGRTMKSEGRVVFAVLGGSDFIR